MDPLTRRGSPPDAELRALLVLDQVPGLGPRRIRRLVERFGSADGALRAPTDAVAELVGRDCAVGRSDPGHRTRVEEGLVRARDLGMRVCTWSDPDYPADLLRLADPPPVLFLRGRTGLLSRGGVAVVGARRCTARARDVARRLGRALARRGALVVSGMALGVDAAAHLGALEAPGDTLAVVGRGADAPYPPSHGRLFRRLVEDGLVVSEFLPGTPPLPHHFPRRNRIMAALAGSVVVVEAGLRSGALITVEHALDLGRDVWAVPGPIDTAVCAGSNQLLFEGARPLVSVRGFAAEVTGGERPGSGAGDVDPPPADDGRVGGDTPEPERRLLACLRDGPLHIDALAAQARLDVPLALAVLVQMELRGAVEQMPGFHFRAG